LTASQVDPVQDAVPAPWQSAEQVDFVGNFGAFAIG
jgi:hypothetical protein